MAPRAPILLLTAGTAVHVVLLLPRFAALFDDADGAAWLNVAALHGTVLATVVGCGLAGLLAVRAWDRSAARAMAVFLTAAVVAWGVVLRAMSFEVVDGSLSAVTSGGLDALLLGVTLYLVASAFLRFSAVFPMALQPDALPAPRWRFGPARLRRLLLRRRWAWGTGLAWPVVTFGMGAAAVAVAATQQTDVPIQVDGLLSATVTTFALLFPVTAMVFGVRNLRAGYRLASDEDRRRTLWLLAGVSASAWLILWPIAAVPIVALSPSNVGLFLARLAVGSWALAPAVLVAAAALAMFYTGGLDPRLVLRRSTVLGILGTVWIASFAALESLASEWLAQAAGLPEAVVSVAIALAAAGVALVGRRMMPGWTDPGSAETPAT